jgi:DNA helicase-2/ATP-dependent DNA helicase PcrA
MVLDNPHALEEERRLFYVAITRARKHCTITCAKNRFRNGKNNSSPPSRFLHDIDFRYIDQADEWSEPVAARTSPARSFTSSYAPQREWHAQSTPPVRKSDSAAHSGESPKVHSLDGFQVGQIIRHERFGTGEIRSLEGSGGDAKATILFEHMGQKSLLLKYAKLTVLKESPHD